MKIKTEREKRKIKPKNNKLFLVTALTYFFKDFSNIFVISKYFFVKFISWMNGIEGTLTEEDGESKNEQENDEKEG